MLKESKNNTYIKYVQQARLASIKATLALKYHHHANHLLQIQKQRHWDIFREESLCSPPRDTTHHYYGK